MNYRIIHGVDLINVHLMAFKVLEGHRVKEIIVEALQAAANRSVELSK